MNDVQTATEMAAEVLGNNAAAEIWIQTKQVALGDKTPREVIEAGGLQRVLNVLNGIKDGGYL